MKNVVVVIGAGQIGQAIARRISVGRHVVLADRSDANANAAAEVMTNAGYEVSVATVDVSSRQAVLDLVGTATGIGDIVGLIQAAGVSPSQASPDTILHVDLYGTAVVLEEFGHVMAAGGSGVVISSQSGHRLPALTIEQNKALATTPTDDGARRRLHHRQGLSHGRRSDRRLLVRRARGSAHAVNGQSDRVMEHVADKQYGE